MVSLILLGVVVLVGIYLAVLSNGLLTLRNRCENAWAQIGAQLERRHDLIPALVEVVEAGAGDEREALGALEAARDAARSVRGPQAQATAEDVLTGALRTVFALGEAYPALKADERFRDIEEELVATEGRISHAREFFNDVALQLNTKIQLFPATVVAGALGLAEREYFDGDDVARGAVVAGF